MLLAVISLALIAFALGFFIYGAIGLSKYAFRLGMGPGLLCLLFPPYTFYFAFFKLEEEGKDFPTAAWLFGILTTALLVGVFWSPLSTVVAGDFASLEAGGAGAAVQGYSSKSEEPAQEEEAVAEEEEATEESAEEPSEEAEDEKAEDEDAPAEGEGAEKSDEDEAAEEAGSADEDS
ncbi:MAG: hypothetical protein ACQEVA_19680 [Myxococcota bacterium]